MFDFLDELLQQNASSNIGESPHIACLQAILAKKYTLMLAYIAYGDQLRSICRDGLFQHFQEHMQEERESIYQLNKKITALSGDASVSPEPIPSIPLNQPRAIFETMLSMEQAVVDLWANLFHQTSEDVPLNAMAQDGALVDQRHADDMRRYLRSEG